MARSASRNCCVSRSANNVARIDESNANAQKAGVTNLVKFVDEQKQSTGAVPTPM